MKTIVHKSAFPYLLAVLDAVPVMVMIMLSLLSGSSRALPIAVTAALMFIWHFGENTWLKARFVKVPTCGYVGFMEWPNIAFTGIVLAAFMEALLPGGYNALPLITLPLALTGCLLTALGIWLRIWAYVTLKHEFVKAPGQNEQYIREGPYRYLRHPANIGFFLVGAGVGLGLCSFAAVITAIVFLLPALIFVSRFESKLLNEK